MKVLHCTVLGDGCGFDENVYVGGGAVVCARHKNGYVLWREAVENGATRLQARGEEGATGAADGKF